MGENNMNIHKIVKIFTQASALALITVVPLNEGKAANVIFSFAQTTANGMDLFSLTTSKSDLITNATSPSVYFALGYVSSSFNFVGATRQSLLAATTYIGSSNNSWVNVGTAEAFGGKANVVFNNGGNGFDTTSYAGSKLVAVISQGVNPFGGSIQDNTNIAIVRGATGWDSVLAPDGSPNPINQVLNLTNFDILVGTLGSNSGNVNSSGTIKFDTIALVPEPSTGALMMIGAAGLVALRRLRKV